MKEHIYDRRSGRGDLFDRPLLRAFASASLTFILLTPFNAFGLEVANAKIFSEQKLAKFRAFEKRVQPSLEALRRDPNRWLGDTNIERGASFALWRTEGKDGLHTIWQVKGLLVEVFVNPKSGNLLLTGMAEWNGSQWAGWWAVTCIDCCPGVNWWDEGTLNAAPKEGRLAITVPTKKMDAKTCKLTDTPDVLTWNRVRVETLQLGEVRPRKVHMLITPGHTGGGMSTKSGQSYKEIIPGSVELYWDVRNLGVSTVNILVRGDKKRGLLKQTKKMHGEHTFRTKEGGMHSFVLMALNRHGEPLHIEIKKTKIP